MLVVERGAASEDRPQERVQHGAAAPEVDALLRCRAREEDASDDYHRHARGLDRGRDLGEQDYRADEGPERTCRPDRRRERYRERPKRHVGGGPARADYAALEQEKRDVRGGSPERRGKCAAPDEERRHREPSGGGAAEQCRKHRVTPHRRLLRKVVQAKHDARGKYPAKPVHCAGQMKSTSRAAKRKFAPTTYSSAVSEKRTCIFTCSFPAHISFRSVSFLRYSMKPRVTGSSLWRW